MSEIDEGKGKRPRVGQGSRPLRSIARDPAELAKLGKVPPEEAYRFEHGDITPIETRPRKESEAAQALELIYPRWSAQVELAGNIQSPDERERRLETLKKVVFDVMSPHLAGDELKKAQFTLFGDTEANIDSNIKTPRDLMGYISNFIMKAGGQGVLPIGKRVSKPLFKPLSEQPPKSPSPKAELPTETEPPTEMEDINIVAISPTNILLETTGGSITLNLVGEKFLIVESQDESFGTIELDGIGHRMRINMLDKFDYRYIKTALAEML